MFRTLHIITIIFGVIVLTIQPAIAQKSPFTGTIIYDVTSEGNLSQETKNMMPKTMVYKYSTDKHSMSINFAMAEQRTIFDPASKNASILMNLMGKKIVVSQTASELQELRKQEGETLVVKETSETKTIAGYLCKKAVLTKKKNGKEMPSTIFYTDAIDVSKFQSFNAFPEIKGVPLEFTMKTGEMEFKVSARSVKKEDISPSEFVISTEYQKFSAAELQKFFGAMGFGK